MDSKSYPSQTSFESNTSESQSRLLSSISCTTLPKKSTKPKLGNDEQNKPKNFPSKYQFNTKDDPRNSFKTSVLGKRTAWRRARSMSLDLPGRRRSLGRLEETTRGHHEDVSDSCRSPSEQDGSERKTYDNFVAEHVSSSQMTSHSATRNLTQVHTMCADLINDLEEQLRDINAGEGSRRKDDIQRRRRPPDTVKENSLSGMLPCIHLRFS
jgi:hypothetical protein